MPDILETLAKELCIVNKMDPETISISFRNGKQTKHPIWENYVPYAEKALEILEPVIRKNENELCAKLTELEHEEYVPKTSAADVHLSYIKTWAHKGNREIAKAIRARHFLKDEYESK